MVNEFYERQMEKIETKEKLKEFKGLVNDYLNANSIEEVSIIKDLIIKKAISELNAEELKVLRESLTERGQSETGKNKMRLYELVAGLYNNASVTLQSFRQLQDLKKEQQERLSENIIPFEVAGGKVEKTELVAGNKKIKAKEKTYEIVGANIEYIGDGKYRVDLEYSRKFWKYGRIYGSDSIVIWFKGGNTIQVFDSEGKGLKIREIKDGGLKMHGSKSEDGGYAIKIEKTNPGVSFEVEKGGSKIELSLTFPGR